MIGGYRAARFREPQRVALARCTENCGPRKPVMSLSEGRCSTGESGGERGVFKRMTEGWPQHGETNDRQGQRDLFGGAPHGIELAR